MNFYRLKNYKESKINSVQITIASSKIIKNWGSRKSVTGNFIGEIKTPQTMNYKTLKPENEGLFCERIFGPINDFECSCGKRYENEFIDFCSHCGIEYVSSRVRRNRLGYIKLSSPVVHVWYAKYISLLLDIPKKSINSMIYCTDEIVFKNILKFFKNKKSQKLKILDNIDNLTSTLPFTLKYSLHIQKDVFLYLRKIKKSFFISNQIKNNLNLNSFDYQYYILGNFYSLSYSFQWEAKRQWNIIVWYLKYKQEMKENFIKLNPIHQNTIKNNGEEFEMKNLFGTRVIYTWLKYFDYNFQLSNLERQIKFHIFEIKEEIKELSGMFLMQGFSSKIFLNFQKKIKRLHWQKNNIFKRLKLITYFRRSKIQPRWMILSVIPVLPPDLRPIVDLGSNKIAVSDLNKSYQTILLRNIRLQKFYNNTYFNDFTEEVRYTKRLLQESVDDLIQQRKSQKIDSQPLKSLSDVLKGKRGRFRQNLLGKRVDYSGRSVIIVDPKLQLHECGIPLKMAIELFYPFIIQYLISFKIVKTLPGAKKLIYSNTEKIINIITIILQNYLVLLNRAPTLHKLGIQAFQPKLILGKAIRLHPLVCPAFNADFDGDQMGMHIPLSFESRAESWKLLWSRNNLLFPALGSPVLTPGQDMVLGCYYLTAQVNKNLKNCKLKLNLNEPKNLSLYFQTTNDVLSAYHQEKIKIHSEIWVKCHSFIVSDESEKIPINILFYKNGNFCFNYFTRKIFYNSYGYKTNQYIKTTVGRILFNNILKKTVL